MAGERPDVEDGESGEDPAEAAGRRREAIAAFQRAWELIDSPERTPSDDSEMLAAAFASRYLWETVGGDEQRAVGDWQIAHVASLLGNADLALERAKLALDRVVQNGWTDWRLASCYEGMARAEAVAGNGPERDRWVALAREVLAGLDDEEDRELIESQLATVPALRPAAEVPSPGAADTSHVRGAAGTGGVGYRIARMDHVQVAMPPGLEAEAEAFYATILAMTVVEKPPLLAAHGGRWFQSGNVNVHLGIEDGFRPAQKAHPALVIEGLDALVEALAAAGYPVKWDEDIPEVRRCFVADPFGNRIELIEA